MANKKKKADQSLAIIVTIFVVGLVISRMLFVSFYNTPKVSAGNVDIAREIELPNSSKLNSRYMCPKGYWIDCMPVVDEERSTECTTTYIDWVKKNCPGFKGVAY